MTQAKMQKILSKYNMRCAYCGYKIIPGGEQDDPFSATVDHVLPKANGGSDSLDNLLPSCFACNHAKDNMGLNEFRNALLTGKSNIRSKDHEIAELKATRYMIPYGKYVGIESYMWGGKFYFEKNKVEQETLRNIADKVQPIMVSGHNPSSSVIDNFFNHPAKKMVSESAMVSVETVKPASKKKVIVVTALNNSQMKRSLTKNEREVVYKTHNYRCALCGCMIRSGSHPVGHHNADITKIRPSGYFCSDNILASCHHCHTTKSNDDLETFRSALFDGSSSKKIMKLRTENYGAFFSDRFFFELSEKEQKDVIADWDQVPVCDSYNIAATEAKDTQAKSTEQVLEQDLTTAKTLSSAAPIYSSASDITKPLTEEYDNLKLHLEGLLQQVKETEERMSKLKTAIDALNAL